MPMLITGPGFIEEHGDCSELKREIHIEKHGMKYIALAFEHCGWTPINEGRYSYKRLLKDIDEYRNRRHNFYAGYKSQILSYHPKKKEIRKDTTT